VLGVPNVRSLDGMRGLTIVNSLRDVTMDDLAALPEAGPSSETDEPRQRFDRRTVILGGLAVVAVLVALFAVLRPKGGQDELVLPPGAIPIDVWAPYWTLDESLPSADARLSQIREVSPFWYGTRSATEITVDEHAPADEVDDFVKRARDSVSSYVPSIRDQMDAGAMAAVIADPATRKQHIDTILEFADEQHADGIDLDYEQFAFSDGEATWATTSPNWVTFVRELADALHADGRTLTVSIPPVYDPAVTGRSGYGCTRRGRSRRTSMPSGSWATTTRLPSRDRSRRWHGCSRRWTGCRRRCPRSTTTSSCWACPPTARTG
jgi:hypothetical protein